MKNVRLKRLLLLAAGVIAIQAANAAQQTKSIPQPPAFPGAEGYGAVSVGGRGGRAIYVTSTDDYNPKTQKPIEGTLRWAVNQKGPRTILFAVSGDIALKTPLRIVEPYITIAGQSSPGGICVRDAEFGTATHDVIVRYVRFRCGDTRQQEEDSFNIENSYNVILDHCSFSWAIDEVLSASENTSFRNGTFQWCLIYEGLKQSYHPKGAHSMGSLLSGDGGLTIHHCLFANNANRNPRSHYLVLDYRNNVVYNWSSNICYTRAAPNFINMADNYYKPGPDTPESRETIAFSPGDDMANIYLAGNRVFNHPEVDSDQARLVAPFRGATRQQIADIIMEKPFTMPAVTTTPAETAYETVLARAGATHPVRDAADARVIEGVRNGTGVIINAPSEVGGYPVLSAAVAVPKDSDGDGMPDAWEKRNKLNPNDPADGAQDKDGDGYTNLEEYLNGTDPRKADSHGGFDFAKALAMGEAAVKMIADKTQEYRDEQQRILDAKEARKRELMATTRAVLSASPDSGERTITLDLNGKATVTLVRIPAGSFMMGASEAEHGEPEEYPRHKVNISKDYYMATTKVSTAQYSAVMGPEAKKFSKSNADFPAPSTTWYEAVDFCDILSAATGLTFRLPTEAEWEYACRAGTTTYFNTGNTITSDQANFNAKEASEFNPAGIVRGKHVKVNEFAPNAWGLYDMHGNESEFCLDNAFRVYTADEVTDPLFRDPEKTRFVIRGGKASSKAFYIRSAYRYSYTPDVGFSFRFVVEVPGK